MVGSCIMKLNFSALFEAVIIYKTDLLILYCRQPFCVYNTEVSLAVHSDLLSLNKYMAFFRMRKVIT